ncbi:MAG: DNA adenine methylase [Rhodospirillales bacterium]|nr:DNA adenine methylase [Rhodospirillales bacterium]
MQTCSTQLSLLPDSSADRSVQRTIHYLGSKLRAVDPIRRAVSAVAPVGQPVCDLFAGSGIVSLALGSDWDVTSVDIQEYSRVLCNGLANAPQNAGNEGAYLCNQANAGSLRSELRSALAGLLGYEQKSLTEAADGSVESLCDLLEYGSLLPLNASRDMPLPLRTELSVAIDNLDALGLARGSQTVVTRHFGGRYFSWEQAIDLDAMLAEIHSLDHGFRDFYLSAAFVVSSDIVNTVGKHFAQPIKLRDGNGHPKRHLVKQTLRDRSLNVFDSYRACCHSLSAIRQSHRSNRAVKSDYLDFLTDDNTPFAAIYADPPYTRDHYSRYYHVLETMALRDDPDVATTKIRTNGVPRLSRGIYRLDRHQSPFCIPTKAPSAFENLFSAVAKRGVPLILSYSPYQASTGNRPRLLTIDQLLDIARRHFGKVEIVPIDGIFHNKLNLTERNVSVEYPAEVLMSCLS